MSERLDLIFRAPRVITAAGDRAPPRRSCAWRTARPAGVMPPPTLTVKVVPPAPIVQVGVTV